MIFVVSAPSGAGKTTLISKLLKFESRLMFSVSTTTRKIRNNEIDGINYYFISKDEFCRMIDNDEFFEWTEVYDNYYGTTKKEIDRIVQKGKIPLFDVDTRGSVSLREKIEDGVFVLIIPPSYKVLKKRLMERKTDSKEQIDLRLENAYKELYEYRNFDYIIVNDKLDEAYKNINAIISANFKLENETYKVSDKLFAMADRCKLENMRDKVERILEDFK
jgi:guanylate kinase